MLAKPEIKKPEDLKGKKLGVSRFGSNSHYFVIQALRKNGMEPTDVTFIQTSAIHGIDCDIVRAEQKPVSLSVALAGLG